MPPRFEQQALHVGKYELRVEEIEAVDVADEAIAVDQEGAEDVLERAGRRSRVRLRFDSLVVGGKNRGECRPVRRGEEEPFRRPARLRAPMRGMLGYHGGRVVARIEAHRYEPRPARDAALLRREVL